MSRFSDYEGDGDDEFNGNGGYMWEKRADLALSGKRGRKALAELREALLALPQPRLIESAVCKPIVENEVVVGGEVCVIGAYAWYQKVKAGVDPAIAFAELPEITDDDGGWAGQETAELGRSLGLTYTLAWELAYRNDEMMERATPEQRWAGFIAFIDKELAKPPLKAAPRRVKKVRQPRAVRVAARGALPEPLGL